jgi:4-diphosphocytidyl-2-C-methyl-D-erythritol kinase
MIVFPNAKINTGLKIRSRRNDGFHNIETVFLPVPLRDILEVVPSKSKDITLKTTGLNVDSPPEKNLVYRAAKLMQERYDTPGVNIHLHKLIPMGAGLGGGSADASFTISVINRIFELDLDKETIKSHAASLGSDCPFFIDNKPSLGTQKGEVLKPVKIPALQGVKVLIVKPDTHISTAEAYAGVTPDPDSPQIEQYLKLPLSQWKNFLVNDFEKSLFPLYPELHKIKASLYELGAEYASMSGSGAALYGFFKEIPERVKEKFPDCFVWSETDIT